ncbi:hypothetical protein ABZ942_24780 [Nocardia sp. NPDC046473]|uniref:hypothetical protein n=1 Tax=Nocardia sp. NPDC046473 TaxID=3155733 RepID=UPI0033E8B968
MPSRLHEGFVATFEQRPRLAVELLTTALDTPLPEFDHARLESDHSLGIAPSEYSANAVVVLTAGTTPTQAVVIEVLLKPDKRKMWSWPVRLTMLRSHLQCPAVLLVICADEHTAAQCRDPIVIAPGCTLTPLVLSPEHVPVITAPATASTNPELAVLSAIAHRNHPDRDAILAGLGESIANVVKYEMAIDLVMQVLPKAGQRFLERLRMRGRASKYMSDFAHNYFLAGEAEAAAKALLAVLRKRGFDISEDLATRVGEQTDIEQLAAWLDQAITADSLAEVFGEELTITPGGPMPARVFRFRSGHSRVLYSSGQVDALETILESRGLLNSPASRARFEECTDPAVLDIGHVETLLRRAANATALEAVFADHQSVAELWEDTE